MSLNAVTVGERYIESKEDEKNYKKLNGLKCIGMNTHRESPLHSNGENESAKPHHK